MKIHLSTDERAIFVGATGSGKTVLARHLLSRLSRVVVIDPKHTFRLDGFSQQKSLPLLGKKFQIIYRPGRTEDDRLANFLDDLLRLKHVTIYCDELATLSERYGYATEVLADIARTGRERFVSVWNAVQRPRWVPRIFFTEAEAIFQFNLRSLEDRVYMAQFVGPEAEAPIGRYEFWYSYADGEGQPALMTYNLAKNYIEKIG